MSTQFEDRLRDAMDQATAQLKLRPGLAAQAQQHRRHQKATARALAAAGTTMAVAAGLAAAGATGAFGSASRQPVETAYTAYVVSHVEHALASPRMGNLLEYDHTEYAPGSTLQPVPDALLGGNSTRSPWAVGYSVNWTYHNTIKLSAFATTGQHVFDVALRARHGSTAVIYRNDTWWTAPPRGAAPGRPVPSGCVRAHLIVLSGGAGNGWPAFIRSQLACGAYTVTGHQVVDGIDTIKVSGNSGQFTFWVNPATYLPVQMELPRQRTEFRWLPPTPANLAQLKVTVPAGFTQVPPPAQPAASGG